MTDHERASVDPEILGRMVIAVRQLEHIVYEVARSAGVLDPHMRSAREALKETKRQARKGLPPWARQVTAEEIIKWADDALKIFRRRNTHIHWYSAHQFTNGRWMRHRFSTRSKERELDEDSDALDLVAQAENATPPAHRIAANLLPQMRPGVLHPHPAMASPHATWTTTLIPQPDGTMPTRPTNAEIRAWCDWLTSSSPQGWATWPESRHAPQRQVKRGAATPSELGRIC